MVLRIQSKQKVSAFWIVLISELILLLCFSCKFESNQPINFNHKIHFQHFINGDHKKANFAMHEELLGEIPEELQQGECLECHDSFEEAAEDIPKIKDCGGCHQIFLETDLRERPNVRPCVACHRNSVKGHKASIPNVEICLACHAEAISDDPEEARLVNFINNGHKINWVRVNNFIAGDTHFSHERHVVDGKLDCRKCHGNVDEASNSLGLINEIKMEDCMDCHEAENADNDCLVCHY